MCCSLRWLMKMYSYGFCQKSLAQVHPYIGLISLRVLKFTAHLSSLIMPRLLCFRLACNLQLGG